MMLSSLYSSLPVAVAPVAAAAAPAIKQNSSDEKRIVSFPRAMMMPRPLAYRELAFKRGGKQRRGKNRSMVPRPQGVIRPIPASIQCRHRFRFVDNTGGTYVITPAFIFGAIGGIVDVVNSSLICWAGSFKIHSIDIYESAQSVTSVSSSISWFSSGTLGFNQDQFWTNTSIPYDRPSVVSSRPPAKSLASDWISSNATLTNGVVGLGVAIGSIVDLVVDFTLLNVATPVALTVTTGTLGGAYYLALDGRASNKIIPVGLPTTS